MRVQGEAEIAIEQGDTRYEGVTWTTRSQIAANQLIPLPEPARRGLINLADDVISATTPNGWSRRTATSAPPPHVRDGSTRTCRARHSATYCPGNRVRYSPSRSAMRPKSRTRRSVPSKRLVWVISSLTLTV